MGTIQKWCTKTYQLMLRICTPDARQVPLHLARGKRAEKLACHFLKARGLLLLERNYHSRCGEIDLIMQDMNILVFVEVRSKSTLTYGLPQETVNFNKQKKLVYTATQYIKSKKLAHYPCRFDIISITYDSTPRIEWLKHAF